MITEAFGRSSALDVYLARQVILVLYTLIVEGIIGINLRAAQG
jgi:hypothetical protein